MSIAHLFPAWCGQDVVAATGTVRRVDDRVELSGGRLVEVAAGPDRGVAGCTARVDRSRRGRRGACSCGSIAALRVTPQVWGDPGVWLSVAARLLDGDRLYADVFDNKDPFFFYSYALSLRVAGVRGPFALEVVWLAVGTLGLAMALRTLRVGTLAVVTGAVVYPLALTASWYVPGATMVPALAIAPLALWLWARGAAVAAGFLVVVAMLFKFNLGLVVAAPLIALLLVGDRGASRRRRAVEGTCGAAVALALCALLLGVRGELRPYLDTIAYNVHYSDAGVHGGGLHAHLEIIREFFAASGKWQLPAAVLATVTLLVVSLLGWQRGGAGFRRVSAAAVATLVAGFVTLATTAVFTVHLQLLAYPAALGCATLVLGLRERWKPLAVGAAATCIALAVRASLGQEDLSALSVRRWTTAPVSTPERRSRRRALDSSPTTDTSRTQSSAATPRTVTRRSSVVRWICSAGTSTSTRSIGRPSSRRLSTVHGGRCRI